MGEEADIDTPDTGRYRGKDARWWGEAFETLQRENSRLWDLAHANDVRADEAEAKISALQNLIATLELEAITSLSRMYGGAPFPATLSAAEVTTILER